MCNIYDNNEYDGISIIKDCIVLIECKDTSFGQNDLYTCMIKAEEIKAETIVIITTKEVHPNVKKQIEKFQKTNKKKLYLISSNVVKEIEKDLVNIFEEKKVKDIKELKEIEKYDDLIEEHISFRRQK